MSPPVSFLQLSPDTQVHVLSFLDALDILSIRKVILVLSTFRLPLHVANGNVHSLDLLQCCKHLAALTRHRVVWTNALALALETQRIPIVAYRDVMQHASIPILMQMSSVPARLNKKFRAGIRSDSSSITATTLSTLTPKDPVTMAVLCPQGFKVMAHTMTDDERYIVTYSVKIQDSTALPPSAAAPVTRHPNAASSTNRRTSFNVSVDGTPPPLGYISICDVGTYCGRRPTQVYASVFPAGVRALRTGRSKTGTEAFIFADFLKTTSATATDRPFLEVHAYKFLYETRTLEESSRVPFSSQAFITRVFGPFFVAAFTCSPTAMTICVWNAQDNTVGFFHTSIELAPFEIYLFSRTIMLVGPCSGYATFAIPPLFPMDVHTSAAKEMGMGPKLAPLVEPVAWTKRPLMLKSSPRMSIVAIGPHNHCFRTSSIPDDPTQSSYIASFSETGVHVLELRPTLDLEAEYILASLASADPAIIRTDLRDDYTVPWGNGIIAVVNSPMPCALMLQKDHRTSSTRGPGTPSISEGPRIHVLRFFGVHADTTTQEPNSGHPVWMHFSPIHGCVYEKRDGMLFIHQLFDHYHPFQSA